MTQSFSTHFKLPIPDFNTSPWHESVESVIRAVDALVYRALVAGDTVLWTNLTLYAPGALVIDPVTGVMYLCRVSHTSAATPTLFSADRIAHPTFWQQFAFAFTVRGQWAKNTNYAFYDLVYDQTLGIIALCTTAHTSSNGGADTINTDVANWAYLAVLPRVTAAANIVYAPGTTGFVSTNMQAVIDEIDGIMDSIVTSITIGLAAKASLNSPVFTGNPTAPTPTVGDNDTSLATTAFVEARRPQNNEILSAMINNDAIAARHLAVSAIVCSGLINGYLSSSVASNQFTIAIKTLVGNDPSAADPVIAIFNNVSAGGGVPEFVEITSAMSFTLTNGSTAGFANTVAGALWGVIVNDAGTARLGLINCLSGKTIYPLGGYDIISSTAEGGVGGADSPQILYTGVAVVNKAFTVLAKFSWEAGLSTAGAWNALPTPARHYRLGMKLPGDIIQSCSNDTGALASTTTVMSFTDTIPQNSEGFQILSQAIQAVSKTNLFEVKVRAIGSNSVSANATQGLALFQDAVANALAASLVQIVNNGAPGAISIDYKMQVNTTSSTTFKARLGSENAGTHTLNGVGGARKYGGVANTAIEVIERMA